MDWTKEDFPHKDQLLILKRICSRGRTLFLDKKDSVGIDMFEHMETEVGRLAWDLIRNNIGKEECS